MQTNPYLTFDGRCREAFEYYAKVLGGEIEGMFTHGESPMAAQTPAPWRSKVMHAQLSLRGGTVLMGSDAPPERYERPNGFSVAVHVDSAAEAQRVFDALADGGRVEMPLQETFWAHRFGLLTDRFGIPWMVNYGRES
ncbi:MAG: VOC family protein [Thermodesulfobacteriota bacterium]